MTVLTSVVGWSFFGLANRLWMLGIKKQPLSSNLWGHAIAMGAFGYWGYWAYQWNVGSRGILADQRKLILDRRERDHAKKAAREAAERLIAQETEANGH